MSRDALVERRMGFGARSIPRADIVSAGEVSRKFVWRSIRFGLPLVRLEKISQVRLDGRLIESPEVGRLVYVAESGYDLIRGGELTDRETEYVRNVAISLDANLLPDVDP